MVSVNDAQIIGAGKRRHFVGPPCAETVNPPVTVIRGSCAGVVVCLDSDRADPHWQSLKSGEVLPPASRFADRRNEFTMLAPNK